MNKIRNKHIPFDEIPKKKELIIQIYLKNGLEKAQLQKIETEFFVKLADNEDFVAMVDSVSVSFLAAN